MQGKVATTKNQTTFSFRVAKRRRGMSRMAQKVGMMGTVRRTIKMTNLSNTPQSFPPAAYREESSPTWDSTCALC